MYRFPCALFSLVAAVSCSNSSLDLGLGSQSEAATFPATMDWIPLQQAATGLGDVNTDGNTSGREIVGSAADPSVYIYNDGVDFFIRLRLDDDPTGAGPAIVSPFGWGLLIDTNGNFNDYEFAVFIDGTGTDEIIIAENTTPTGVGDPADNAETVHFATPADDGVDGNVVISMATTMFSGNADYFLDFAVPLAELQAAGLDLTGTFSFIAGTSNNGRALSVDIVGCDGICSLGSAASDPTGLDGSIAVVDIDGDAVSDLTDFDDDNDGIPDSTENTLGVNPTGDADNDGVPNWRDGDDEGDGSSSCTANMTGVCAAPSIRFDFDQDGVPNHLDLDSDNDGIADLLEAGHGAVDANDDGLVDGILGGNGLVDSLETSSDSGFKNYPIRDTDGDGSPDFLDLDSDGDGDFDLDEVGGTAIDVDNDGIVDGAGDADGDGILGAADNDENAFGFPMIDLFAFDADNDGIPSPYDADEGGPDSGDSDGDGLSDDVECAGAWPLCLDTNSDGWPNYSSINFCGNNMLDPGEGCDDGNELNDANGCSSTCLVMEGYPCNDDAAGATGNASCQAGVCDMDGGSPGICDSVGPPVIDTDGDGVEDANDLDDDNDGLLDSLEGDGNVDTDGDSVPDSKDLDSDNDGILDVEEAGHGMGGSIGTVDCPEGVGANGVCDAMETEPDSGITDYILADADGDEIPNFQDLDSDGDTIGDSFESGFACLDVDAPSGVCDGRDSDRDGVVDSLDSLGGHGSETVAEPIDSDGDGLADYIDTDSDGDGITDIVENDLGDLDSDGDGDADSGDSDGDGIDDGGDLFDGFGGARDPIDSDDDSTPDHRDTDSDNDSISDADEAGEDPNNPPDTDGDGDPDYRDSDSDDDTVEDDVDNCRTVINIDQSDIDRNGIGTVCQEDSEFGIQGGGCSTAGGSSGSAALLFLGALLLLGLGRRSGRLAMGLLMGLALATLTAADARAQVQLETDYPVERLRLSSDSEGVMDVEWAAVTGHNIVDLGLWMGWADDPLNLYVDSGNGRERIASPVASRMAGNLLASIGLWSRFQLGVEIPLILYQSDSASDLMTGAGSPTSFGMGDIRLVPKLGILRQQEAGVNLGFTLGLTLPTSSSDDYFGESTSFVPEVLVSRSFRNGLRLASNFSYVVRERFEVVNLVVDDEITAKAGIGFRLDAQGGPPVELDLTYALATGADDMFGAFNRNHSELKGGAVYNIPGPVSVFAATGVGIAEGFGTPDWRLFAGVRFQKELSQREAEETIVAVGYSDRDGDGLQDDEDQCPDLAENVNGIEDSDGCPESPETDGDTDGDGLTDSADSCISEPEDADGFEDGDGCPDPDNDGDGVLDADDRCINEPGVVALQGCPESDRDGDTIVDAVDQCPDEPGVAEFKGCSKRQLVDLSGGKLEILDVVYFALNKAKILSKSYALLDNVAEVISAHPELLMIRVEGHTDGQGNDQKNKKLSQRRANAVLKYLIQKGVAASRLEAVGHGEEIPIDTNDTKEGRAANRRVEFKLVGSASSAIKAERTGPAKDTIEE